jgi:hypothetical protein
MLNMNFSNLLVTQIIMRKIIFPIAIFFATTANAQNYLISFTGNGASTSVNSVKVENLMKGTSLTLNGSDILRLTTTTGVNSTKDTQQSDLKIYPNPMYDYTTLQVCPPGTGNATITVLDIAGKTVSQTQSFLENSPQEFKLSGINKGFYLITIKGNDYQFSAKLISN